MKRNIGPLSRPDGPRKAAWRALVEWEAASEALETIRDRHTALAKLDRRDRALVTELTQGTVRHLLFLDHAIRGSLDRPDLTLPAPVLQALRLGAYQLIHLHKIPAHAAVKETVQIVKDSRYRRFASLVNAVLRKISDRGAPPVPGFEDDPVAHLELSTSTPRWLVERLISQNGTEGARGLLQALNRTPPLTLRTNTLKSTRDQLISELEHDGVAVFPGKLAVTAVTVEDRTPPWELKPFLEGKCTVQDEGAQIITPLLGPSPGMRILDACAAPGGKAGHLAQLLDGQGVIVAADRSPRRVRMISESLERLGAKGVFLLVADLRTATAPLAQRVFDRILLDVPCSGTGVLRRHPEGKWKKDMRTIEGMADLQEDLLGSASRTLKKGGRLLYTTCSLLKDENEDVVDRFLAASPDLERLDLRAQFPAMRPDIFTERGELRLWPHRHNCDGFFACLMEKRS